MIGIDKGWIISSFLLFLVLTIESGTKGAFMLTILAVGMMHYMASMILIYLRLRDARFNFKEAASKKEWIGFIVENAITWIVLFIVLPKKLFLYFGVLYPHFILVFLLIIDIVRQLFKRMFR